MADQFSGLDTRENRTRKIVHTCDLQHVCRFAHEKDWDCYSLQNANNNPSNFRICTYVQKRHSSKQGMALTLRDGGATS